MKKIDERSFHWDAEDETQHEPSSIDVGRLAVDRGLVTAEQYAECLREQQEEAARGRRVQIIQILLRKRLVDLPNLVELATGGGPRTAHDIPVLTRFHIEGELGTGGMGVVYRARDKQLGRVVALKILRGGFANDPMLLERFHREAKIVAGLSHPGIVSLHDVGQEEGWTYLVMELVEGEPLDKVLARDEHPMWWYIELLVKIARAVHHANQLGIVHRDLKPGNVLVNREDEPKLLDFGLARIDEGDLSMTRTGAVIGTPLYMAPEQAQGDSAAISPRTDVYSLGAILYEMLTRKPPHHGISAMHVLGKVLNEEPLPPRRVNPRTPVDLEAIALKALAKSPAARYQTAAELADDLERYMDHRPILAKRHTVLRRGGLWLRRHQFQVGLTASGLLAFFLTLALVAWALPAWRSAARRRHLAEFEETARAAVEAEVERLGTIDPQAVVRDAVPERVAARVTEGVAPAWDDEREVVERVLADYRPGPVLSKAYFDLGDWSRAYRYDPSGDFGAKALLEIARRFAGQRRLPEAAQILHRVRARSPDPEGLALLGEVLVGQGDLLGGAAALAAAGRESALTRVLATILAERQSIPLPPTIAKVVPEPMPILELGRPTLLLPDRVGRPAFELRDGAWTPTRGPLDALAPSDHVIDAAAGDFDRDGRTDVLVIVQRPGTGSGFVLLSRTGDVWRVAREVLTSTTPPIALAVGDVDRDGGVDALVLFRYEAAAHWLVRSPSAEVVEFHPGGPRAWAYGPSIGDLDGDGTNEIVLGRSIQLGGRLEVLRLERDGLHVVDGAVVGESGLTLLLPRGLIAAFADVQSGYLEGPVLEALGPAAQDALVILRMEGGRLVQVARHEISVGDPEGVLFGNLAAGRLDGEDAIVCCAVRGEVERGKQRPEGFRIRVLLGDPASPPAVLGYQEGISAIRLFDLDRDGDSEWVLVSGDRLVVRGRLDGPLPPLPPASAPAPTQDEPTLLLDAARELFEFEEYEIAREAFLEVRTRFPGTEQAAEAERLRLESLLRMARAVVESRVRAIKAGELAESEALHAETMRLYTLAATEAREAAERLRSHPEYRRRLLYLAAEASTFVLDRDGWLAARREAAAALPGADDPDVTELDRLAYGPEVDVLSGDPAADDLPFVADLPLRLARREGRLVAALDAHSGRHVAGVPIVYDEGPLSLEMDLELGGSVWCGDAHVGLVPADSSIDPMTLPGRVRIYLHGTSSWDRMGARIGLGDEDMVGVDRFRGRWRLVYAYRPEFGVATLEVRDLEAGGQVVGRVRQRTGTLPPGRYVFGTSIAYGPRDALVSHAFHPAVNDLALGRVVLRATSCRIDRDPPIGSRRLLLAAGGTLFRGDRAGAADLYRRALESDPTLTRASVHLALLTGDSTPLERAFELLPYSFVADLDDAVRGARASDVLGLGAVLRALEPTHPGLCHALGGDVDHVYDELPGTDAATRYLRRRGQTGPPERLNEDWDWLISNGYRTAGNELPIVIWSPAPGDTAEVVRRRASESIEALQKPGATGADAIRAWIALSRLLLLAPDDRNALSWRGQIATALDRRGHAELDWRRAAELAPDDPEGWLLLAIHFASFHATRETLDLLERARALGLDRSVLDRKEEFAFLAGNERFESLRNR